MSDMTPTELNARAAEICGLRDISVLPDGRVLHRPWRSLDQVPFDPCTNPADCELLKQAMREKGWRIYGLFEMVDGWQCEWINSNYHVVRGPDERPKCEYHAVTLAAVRAVEGE